MELVIIGGGAIVAIIVQIVKKYAGTSAWVSVLAAVLVSFAAAAIYNLLQWAGFWEGFMQLMATATTIYAVVIKQFEA